MAIRIRCKALIDGSCRLCCNTDNGFKATHCRKCKQMFLTADGRRPRNSHISYVVDARDRSGKRWIYAKSLPHEAMTLEHRIRSAVLWQPPRQIKFTLGELLEADRVQNGLNRRNQARHFRIMETLIDELGGKNIPIISLTAGIVGSFCACRLSGVGRKQISRKKILAPSTINSQMRMLKGMISWAASTGLIQQNPIMAWKPLPVKKKGHHIDLFPEQAEARIAATDKFLQPLLMLLLNAPLRLQEAIDLNWDQIRWRSENASLRHSVIIFRANSGTKSNRQRLCPILPQAEEALLKLRAEHPKGNRVFTNANGIPWTQIAINKKWCKTLKVIDVQQTGHITIHNFKREACRRICRAYESEGKLVAMHAADHSSERMTEEYLGDRSQAVKEAIYAY